MKKILTLFVALLLAGTTAFAQKRETRDVSTFTKIHFRTPGKIYVRQGSPQKVEIEGSTEMLEKIKTKVDGGKLSIGPDERWNNWSWGSDDKVIVYVTVSNVQALSVSGSGNLVTETKIVTPGNLSLDVSGSGSLTADIEAADVDSDVSGSGSISVQGKCKNFSADVSGSGKIKVDATINGKGDFEVSGSGQVIASGSASDVKVDIAGSGKVLGANLVTNTCSVDISGSGGVEINVQKELEADISGSGTVLYKGNPAHVNANSSGSGRVRKM